MRHTICVILFLAIINFSCTKENFQTEIISAKPKQLNESYYTLNSSLKNSLPTMVDLSSKMPTVGNQFFSNSCGAWAVGYYCKTYQEAVEKDWDPDKNTFSPAWIYNQLYYPNGGGVDLEEVFDLFKNKGCDLDENFPLKFYDDKPGLDTTTQPFPASFTNALHYKSGDAKKLDLNDIQNMKDILANKMVFVINMPVYPDFRNLGFEQIGYDSIYDTFKGQKEVDHSVCVCGYNDKIRAFKIINSWGKQWGMEGYGWISYDLFPKFYQAFLLDDQQNVYDTDCLLGDFNADNKQDILTANGDGLYVSFQGANGLRLLSYASGPISNFAVGDFNGDDTSDVFFPTGSTWFVKYSGKRLWTKINSSSIKLASMKFGDFNGDGKTDVFYANGSTWMVSYSGTSHWTKINSSTVKTSSIAIGDFNGDGKDDVFYPSGTDWKVSYSGTSAWVKIGSSIETISTLQLGDFNGDGKTDVFCATGSQWKVSYSGTSKWTKINTSSVTKNLKLGDFNSNKICDVFYPTTSIWRISWSGTKAWDTL